MCGWGSAERVLVRDAARDGKWSCGNRLGWGGVVGARREETEPPLKGRVEEELARRWRRCTKEVGGRQGKILELRVWPGVSMPSAVLGC